MSYAAKGENVFSSQDLAFPNCSPPEPKRSDHRLKRFQSTFDKRAWHFCEEVRSRHFHDLMSGSQTCLDVDQCHKYVPLDDLIKILMAEKDELIRELEERLRVCCHEQRDTGEKELMQNQIEGLTEEVTKSRDMLRKAMHKLENIDEIVNENKALQCRLRCSEERVKYLEGKKRDLESELADLRTKSQIQMDLEKAQEMLSAVKQREETPETDEAYLQCLALERDELQEKVKILENELEESKKKEAEIEMLKKQSQSDNLDKEEMSRENECYRKKLASMKCLEKQIQELKKQGRALADKYKREAQKAAEQVNKMCQAAKELQNLREERDSLRKRVKELSSYECQFNKLQRKLQRVDAVIAENENLNGKLLALEKLEKENEYLRCRLESIQEVEINAAEDKERIMQLQCAVADQEEEMKDLLCQIERLTSGRPEEELERLKCELYEKNSKLKLCEEQLAEIPMLEAEIDELRMKLQCCCREFPDKKKGENSYQKVEVRFPATSTGIRVNYKTPGEKCSSVIGIRREEKVGLKDKHGSCQEILQTDSKRAYKVTSTEYTTKKDLMSCEEVHSLLQSSKGIISCVLEDMIEHQKEMEDLEMCNRSMKEEIESLKAKVGSSDKDCLLEEVNRLKRALEEKDAEISRLQSSTASAGQSEDIETLRELNNQMKVELEAACVGLKQVANLEKMLEKEHSARCEAESRLRCKEQSRSAEVGRVAEEDPEFDCCKALQRETDDLKLQIEALNKLTEELKRENELLRELQQPCPDFSKELDEKCALENLLSLLQAELDAFRGQKLSDECEALRNELKRVMEQNCQLKALLGCYRQRLDLEKKSNELNQMKLGGREPGQFLETTGSPSEGADTDSAGRPVGYGTSFEKELKALRATVSEEEGDDRLGAVAKPGEDEEDLKELEREKDAMSQQFGAVPETAEQDVLGEKADATADSMGGGKPETAGEAFADSASGGKLGTADSVRGYSAVDIDGETADSEAEGKPGFEGSPGERTPGKADSTDEGKPGFEGSAGERTPGRAESTDEGKPGFEGSAGERTPGRAESTDEGKPGFEDSAGGRAPGKAESADEGKPGFEGSPGGRTPGKEDSADEGKPGFEGSPGGRTPGKVESADEGKPGFEGSPGGRTPGKADSADEEKPGFADSGVRGKPEMADSGVGGKPEMADSGVGGKPEMADSGVGGKPEMSDATTAYTAAGEKPEMADTGVGGKPEMADAATAYIEAGGKPGVADPATAAAAVATLQKEKADFLIELEKLRNENNRLTQQLAAANVGPGGLSDRERANLLKELGEKSEAAQQFSAGAAGTGYPDDWQALLKQMEAENAEKLKKLLDQHEKELAQREKTYNENLSSMKSGYETDIRKLAERHRYSIMRLQELHEDEVQEMNLNYETQMETMQTQSEAAIKDVAKGSAAKARKLAEQHSKNMKDAERKFHMALDAKESEYLAQLNGLRDTLTKSKQELEVLKKRAQEGEGRSTDRLKAQQARELQKARRVSKQKLDGMKKVLEEERKKSEAEIESLKKQLAKDQSRTEPGKGEEVCECKFSKKKPPRQRDPTYPLDFNEVLEKILQEGLDSLTFNELALVHRKTCCALEGIVLKSNTSALLELEPPIGDGCPHTPLLEADKQQLLSRIFSLENAILQKQRQTQEAIIGMEVAIKKERCRLQEVRNLLQNEQQKNSELKLLLSSQTKLQTDLKKERDRMGSQASVHQSLCQEKTKQLDEEKRNRMCLEAEVEKLRSTLKHLCMSLEVARGNSDSKHGERVELMRTKLEQAIHKERRLALQLENETKSRMQLQCQLQTLRQSLKNVVNLPEVESVSRFSQNPLEAKSAKERQNLDQINEKRNKIKTKSVKKHKK